MKSDLQVPKKTQKNTPLEKQRSPVRPRPNLEKHTQENKVCLAKNHSGQILQKQRPLEKQKQVSQAKKTHKTERNNVCQCGKQSSKNAAAKKLIDLKYEVQLLTKEAQSVQEEVYLLLANFSFIVELTAENLNRETAARVQKILKQKNQIILKQKEKIQLLEESQIEIRSQKNQSQNNYKDRFQEALVKIQELEAQNKTLKQLNLSTRVESSASSSINFQNNSVAHKKTSDSSHTGIFPILEEEEGLNNSCRIMESRKYRVKKRNTVGIMLNDFTEVSSPPEIEDKIKSLGNLKMKIHRLKAELKQGYQIQN